MITNTDKKASCKFLWENYDPAGFSFWKIGKIKLLLLVYNKSSFHVFKTKNVENVESRNYQRLFKIENVEENV